MMFLMENASECELFISLLFKTSDFVFLEIVISCSMSRRIFEYPPSVWLTPLFVFISVQTNLWYFSLYCCSFMSSYWHPRVAASGFQYFWFHLNMQTLAALLAVHTLRGREGVPNLVCFTPPVSGSNPAPLWICSIESHQYSFSIQFLNILAPQYFPSIYASSR